MDVTNKDSVQGFLHDVLDVTPEWGIVCGLGAAAAEIVKEATAQLDAKNAEIARLTSEVSELRRLGDELKDAARLVEWGAYDDVRDTNYCTCCYCVKENGHGKNCNVGVALDGWERAAKSQEHK